MSDRELIKRGAGLGQDSVLRRVLRAGLTVGQCPVYVYSCPVVVGSCPVLVLYLSCMHLSCG